MNCLKNTRRRMGFYRVKCYIMPQYDTKTSMLPYYIPQVLRPITSSHFLSPFSEQIIRQPSSNFAYHRIQYSLQAPAVLVTHRVRIHDDRKTHAIRALHEKRARSSKCAVVPSPRLVYNPPFGIAIVK